MDSLASSSSSSSYQFSLHSWPPRSIRHIGCQSISVWKHTLSITMIGKFWYFHSLQFVLCSFCHLFHFHTSNTCLFSSVRLNSILTLTVIHLNIKLLFVCNIYKCLIATLWRSYWLTMFYQPNEDWESCHLPGTICVLTADILHKSPYQQKRYVIESPSPPSPIFTQPLLIAGTSLHQLIMMNSEESYIPYYSLNDAPRWCASDVYIAWNQYKLGGVGHCFTWHVRVPSALIVSFLQ